MTQGDRLTGMVVRIFPDKGFGFIRDDKGTEYFFHRSAVREGWDSLTINRSVSFVVENNPKGPRAGDVFLT